MIDTTLSRLRVAAFCLPLTLVASCGTESGGHVAPPAPPGSTITVNPNEYIWTATAGVCTNTVMQDNYFSFVVRNPSGIPMTNVGLAVSLDLSPGTFVPPPQVMYLFDDLDGDGLFTDPITVFPYYVSTGGAGTKILMVRYDIGGCEYGGNLYALSGTAYGSTHISVENP